MIVDFRIWLTALIALLATSYSPHPAHWGVVALFVLGQPAFWARLGRVIAVKLHSFVIWFRDRDQTPPSSPEVDQVK